MSSAVSLSPAELAGSTIDQAPARPLAQQAMIDVLREPRARAGLLWIGLLALAALFAPFIASSHPIAMKVAGKWSSPLLEHLTPADVVLVIAAVVVALLIGFRRLSFRRSLLILMMTLAVSIPLAIRFVNPPQTIVYERYRQLEREGKVQAIYRTPIPYSANDRLRDLPEMRLTGPSPQHWLGTESSGADLLSRIIHASRIALAIGFISQGIAVVLGVFVGGVMGYYVGKIDILGMRVIEVFEAVPRLFLLITFAAFFGRNLYMMMAIIGLTGWTGDARFIRSEFLRLRNQDFVQAARAAGLPIRSILFRHMLPNGIAPVLVSASFGVASAILLEATLSFLGLGLVDEPSWGEMLNQARAGGVSFFWWIAIFPGLMIFLTVFAYNQIGEALRDAIYPKLRGVN